MLAELLKKNPLVVTGMGAVSAAGLGVPALWERARSGTSPAAWFDPGPQVERIAACQAPPLDKSADLQPFHKMDRSVQMAGIAALEAWRQAGLHTSPVTSERVGVSVGSSRGPVGKLSETGRAMRANRMKPSLAAHSTQACLSGALGRALGVSGSAQVLSATCASAAYAIAHAAEQILLGKADMMLVGGAEAPLEPWVIAQFAASRILGNHDDPALACRPFDRGRNGMVLGEGAGFLILESEAFANRRGAAPLARLSGWATASDAGGRVGMTSGGEGLLRVMRQCASLADTTPSGIGYLNTHGTGTVLNDRTEAAAIAAFSEGASIPCSSTKPVTGHCIGATPALEAIIAIEALRHCLLPPTPACRDLDPACPISVVHPEARTCRLERVMSTSSGFWGTQAALMFSRHE